MVGITVTPKRWGNSVAIILPRSAVKEAQIEVGKPLTVLIPTLVNFSPLWGALKTRKSTKRLKEEAAAGWQ